MKMPCEIIIWYVLPGIRREIAKSLLKNGLSQKETAKKLGITDAAVSQYLSEKRAKIEIKDKKILKEIKKSAERIIAGDESMMIKETCRVCDLLKSSKMMPRLYKMHYNKSISKCFCINNSENIGVGRK